MKNISLLALAAAVASASSCTTPVCAENEGKYGQLEINVSTQVSGVAVNFKLEAGHITVTDGDATIAEADFELLGGTTANLEGIGTVSTRDDSGSDEEGVAPTRSLEVLDDDGALVFLGVVGENLFALYPAPNAAPVCQRDDGSLRFTMENTGGKPGDEPVQIIGSGSTPTTWDGNPVIIQSVEFATLEASENPEGDRHPSEVSTFVVRVE